MCKSFYRSTRRKDLAEEYHQSLLIVTHDLDFATKTHRTITMEDGRILSHGLAEKEETNRKSNN